MKIRAILFDLDGTLLDTAPDLALALNRLLRLHAFPERTFESIRPYVSHGTSALIEFGFGVERSAPNFKILRNQLVAFYEETLALHTQTFPGISEVLSILESEQIPWGVVTNKSAQLTKQLFDALSLPFKADCVICGDTLGQCKPHPAPILHACQLLGVNPQETLVVGDAKQDIEAGKAAGTKTLLALYGYLHEKDTPLDWKPDGTIRHPLEILDWL